MKADKLIENAGELEHRAGLKRILAPTDLGPDARKSVDYAIALAEHFNAQLTLLHVYAAPISKISREKLTITGLRRKLGPL